MSGHWVRAFQFWLDGFGQLLAQLNTPLIKGVDVPYDALSKDLVLVHGNEHSQVEGRHLVHNERIGWPVTFKNLVGKNFFNEISTHPSFLQFSFGFVL